jgi:hypothetical protein
MPKPTKETKQVEKEVANVKNNQTDENGDVQNIKCSDLKIGRLYFKALTAQTNATQLMCYPKYMYNNKMPATPENLEKYGESLILVTGPIKMVRGGIPKYNSQYHDNGPDGMKRANFFIPLNQDDPNSVELFDAVSKMDKYMDEEINQKKNENSVLCAVNKNGKRSKLKGITYKPMITTAKPGSSIELDDGDDEDNNSAKGKKGDKNNKDFNKDKKEFVPWDRIRVRLSTVYDENLGPNDRKDINTQLFVGDKDEPEKITTVSEFEKHFMWNCTAQFALMFHKVWIKKSDDRTCGIGVKAIQIGVTEQPEYKKNQSITKQLNKKLFASAPSGQKHDKVSTKSSANINTNTNANANDNDDEGERESDDQDNNHDDDNDNENDNDDKHDDDNKSDGDDNQDNKPDDGDASEPESEEEQPAPKNKKGAVTAKSNESVKVKGKGSKPETNNSSKKGKK